MSESVTMPEPKSKRTKRSTGVEPFSVEADAKRNNDILLQNIPNCRLRSRITASRTVKDSKTGEERIPSDQARHLGMLPEVPGMQLHVNPDEGKVVIYDPLSEDPDLCARVQRGAEQSFGMSSNSELRGVPTREETLDPHQMKTLCREILWLVGDNDMREKHGSLPTQGQVDEMPGDYLQNPGSRVGNTQPKFEKDMPRFVAELNRTGH